MNRGLSAAIGFGVLAAVAFVSYRIWQDQQVRGHTAAEADGAAATGAAPVPPAIEVDIGSFELPDTRPQAGAGHDAARVAGIVLLPDGQPASGATVRLYRALSPWPEWRRQELETAYTSVDGAFRFETERGPDLLVGFEHPQHAGDLVRAEALNPRLVLHLEPGFEVTGFVLNNIGAGVGEATVTLEPTLSDTRRARSQQTGNFGYFRFTNVRAGSVRVVARHPLWQPAVLPMVTVGASTGLELRFDTPAFPPLQGKVLAAATGEPVAGAEVRALPNTVYRGLFDPLVAVTGEDGAFRLQGLGRGNLRLEVRHPEYSTVSRPIAVSPSSTSPLFELTPRSQVRGRLVDQEGLLDGERTLRVMLRNTAGDMERVTVGADGRFAFSRSFSSGPGTLEIEGGLLAFERTSSFDTQVRIEDAPLTELVLAVTAPSVVLGRVLGPQGDPVAGARVVMPREYQKLLAPDRLLAITGEDGTWRVRGLPAGNLSLRIEHDDYAAQRLAVEVPAPGATRRASDVVLQRPGAISGRVTRGGPGRPLAGALVSVTSGAVTATTVSLPDGRFLLGGLPTGTYRVRARYSTLPMVLADRQADVRPGEVVGPIALDFPAGRTVSGMVVGSDDQPVEGAVVTVLEMAGAGSVTTTDSSGRFSLEVPSRRVEIQAFVGDRAIHCARVLGPEEDEVVLELDTPPTALLVARVYGLPGRKPMAGGLLRVVQEDAGEQVRAVEMSGGELRYPWFPAGKGRLMVQCEGYAPFVADFDVRPGQQFDLGDVLLEPGSVLAGRVVDAEGNPVANAEVFLGAETDRELLQPQTHSGPDGTFRVAGVSSLSRQVVVWAPGYATRTVRLDLPRDVLRSDPLPIVLDRGSRIEVEVLESDGRPRRGGFVLLLRAGRMLAFTDIGEEGLAVFPHRGPGRYEVQLFGHQDLTESVEVTAAGQVHRIVLR